MIQVKNSLFSGETSPVEADVETEGEGVEGEEVEDGLLTSNPHHQPPPLKKTLKHHPVVACHQQTSPRT